jgi:ABC-type nickel/cobalt efflux system permease component RcnA
MMEKTAVTGKYGMTNMETAKAAGGTLLAVVAAATSYVDQIEQYARIGASIVAILAGSVVIWSTILKHINRKDKKHEIPEEDSD